VAPTSPQYLPPGPPGPPETPTAEPAGSSWPGVGADLRNLLILMAITALIIFVVLQQCSPTQKIALCQTVPPATIGLPPDWQPSPHSQSESEEPDYSVEQALSNLIVVLETFERDNPTRPVHVNEQFNIAATIRTYLRKQEVGLVMETPISWALVRLTISDRLAATLAEPPPQEGQKRAFIVSPSDPQEQVISNCEPNTWTWQVTPQIPNDQILSVTFDAILTIDGKQEKRTLETYDEGHGGELVVHVDPERKELLGGWIGKVLDKF
jgi:hypothetical protein